MQNSTVSFTNAFVTYSLSTFKSTFFPIHTEIWSLFSPGHSAYRLLVNIAMIARVIEDLVSFQYMTITNSVLI